jgi:hypothetical protein
MIFDDFDTLDFDIHHPASLKYTVIANYPTIYTLIYLDKAYTAKYPSSTVIY